MMRGTNERRDVAEPRRRPVKTDAHVAPPDPIDDRGDIRRSGPGNGTATTRGEPLVAPPGLEAVIVADTRVGDVRGGEGFYHYRQYSAVELAASRSFEDVTHLMIEGWLPGPREREQFGAELSARRALPD